jgi:hypothetical protein
MFRCIRESGDREVCAGLRETLGGAVRAGRGGRGPSTHGEPYGRCRGVEAVVRRAIPVGVRPGLRTGRGIVEILPLLDLARRLAMNRQSVTLGRRMSTAGRFGQARHDG